MFGGFTPFTIDNFAPFSSQEDAEACQRDMIEYFNGRLKANPGLKIVRPPTPKGMTMRHK
jgi:hypothetical protein